MVVPHALGLVDCEFRLSVGHQVFRGVDWMILMAAGFWGSWDEPWARHWGAQYPTLLAVPQADPTLHTCVMVDPTLQSVSQSVPARVAGRSSRMGSQAVFRDDQFWVPPKVFMSGGG